jgi:hypothetical protein
MARLTQWLKRSRRIFRVFRRRVGKSVSSVGFSLNVRGQREWGFVLVAILVGTSSGLVVRHVSTPPVEVVEVPAAPPQGDEDAPAGTGDAPDAAEAVDSEAEPDAAAPGVVPPFGGQIPDWVFSRDGVSPSPGRRYAELGTAPTGEVRAGGAPSPAPATPAPAAASPPAATQGGDTEPLRPVSALVARRLSGSSMSFHDVGFMGAGDPIGDRWAVPGVCDVLLSIDDSPDQDRVVGMGREHASTGGWIMSFVLPQGECSVGSRRYLSHMSPSADERRGLSYASQTSPLVREMGAPGFQGDELSEFVRLQNPSGDGVWAWGVFRKPLRTTRVAPPPPQPQIAFVASSRNGADWEIVWARYSDTSAEVLGLAGVIRDGADLKAVFGVRTRSGSDRILEIAPDGAGTWGLRDTHAF